jgi:hypothetical protein
MLPCQGSWPRAILRVAKAQQDSLYETARFQFLAKSCRGQETANPNPAHLIPQFFCKLLKQLIDTYKETFSGIRLAAV